MPSCPHLCPVVTFGEHLGFEFVVKKGKDEDYSYSNFKRDSEKHKLSHLAQPFALLQALSSEDQAAPEKLMRRIHSRSV